MAYCSDQWGNIPIGGAANIPTGFCSDPTNLTAVVNGNKALLSWVAPHDFLRFEVLHWKDGDVPPVTPIAVYGQSVWIDNLDPTTLYHWQVRLVCEDIPLRVSAYVNGPDFTTTTAAAVCPHVAANSLVFTPLFAGMHVSWPPTTGFNVVSYSLVYRVKGNDLTSVIVPGIIGTSYIIPKAQLLGNTIYEVKVIRYCNGVATQPDGWSEFSTAALPCTPAVTGIGLVGLVGSNSALITWNYNGTQIITGYEVKLNGVVVAPLINQLPFALQGLSPETAYTVCVTPISLTRVFDPESAEDPNTRPLTSCRGETACFSFTTSKNACNPPLNVVVTKVDMLSGLDLVGYAAQIDWTAAVGATGYRIYMNGALVTTLGPAVFTYLTSAFLSGSVLLEVSTVCNGVESIKVGGIVTFPVGCLGPHSMVLTADHNSITVNFNRGNASTVNVVLSQAGTVISTLVPGGSQAIFSNLLPNTLYDVELNGSCDGIGKGPITTNSITTSVKPTCIIPVIDSVVYQEPKKALLTWHLPNGQAYGTFKIKINDGPEITVVDQFTYLADVSAFAAGATVNFKVGYAGVDCTIGFASQDLLLPTVCAAYSGYVFTWLTATSLQIAAPGTPYTDHSMYVMQNGTKFYFLNYGTALPATVALNKGFYEVFAQGKCGALFAAEQKVYTPCYEVTNLVASSGNGSISGVWSTIPGVWGYEVEIVGVTTGAVTFRVQSSSFTRGGFSTDALTYSVRVRPICYWVGATEITGPWTLLVYTTMTSGVQAPANCSYPLFNTFYEKTVLSDGSDGGVTADNSDPATLNFKTIQGDSFDRSLTFKDSAMVLIDITGYTFDMWVVDPATPLVPILVFSSAGGSILNGGATGTIQLMKTEAEMNVVPIGVYRYSLEWTTPASIVKTLLVGDFTVLEQITQA